jgi:hypothetical protein
LCNWLFLSGGIGADPENCELYDSIIIDPTQ